MVLSARMLRLAGWSLIVPIVVAVILAIVAINAFGLDKYALEQFIERISDNLWHSIIYRLFQSCMVAIAIFPYFVFKKYINEKAHYSGLNVIINIIIINHVLSLVMEWLFAWELFKSFTELLDNALSFILGLGMIRVQKWLMSLGKIITRSVLIASASVCVLKVGGLLFPPDKFVMWLAIGVGILSGIAGAVAYIALIMFFFRAYEHELFSQSRSTGSLVSTSA
jgi:hypothetical protein